MLSGTILAKPGYIPMTKSGFCQFGPDHTLCYSKTCDCTCHTKAEEDDSS